MKHAVAASRKKGQGGNALIEFALCSAVMLIMVCGVSDFARLFNIANMAVGAASAGIGYASIGPQNWTDYPGIRTAALNDTGNYPGATETATVYGACSVGGTQVAYPAVCTSGTAETYVQVSVTIPFTPVFHYPGLPNPVSITQVASARVQ